MSSTNTALPPSPQTRKALQLVVPLNRGIEQHPISKASTTVYKPETRLQSHPYKHLPPETWMNVCKDVGSPADLARLAAVSKYLGPIAAEALYKDVTLCSLRSLRNFRKTLKNHPQRAALIRNLKIEWTEDRRVRTPTKAGKWFLETMDVLRNGNVKHLTFLVFPAPDGYPWTSSFLDLAILRTMKTLGRPRICLPQSLRTVETKDMFIHTCVPVPTASRQPVAPLVALSLLTWGCLLFEPSTIMAPTFEKLCTLRIVIRDPELHHHPLWFWTDIHLVLPNIKFLEVVEDVPDSQGPPRRSPGMAKSSSGAILARVTGRLPGLRMLVWIPAWGDVEVLSPGTTCREYFEDVRQDVFRILPVRTFVIMLPRVRCVRFESTDEEPRFDIVPRSHFDDLDWRSI